MSVVYIYIYIYIITNNNCIIFRGGEPAPEDQVPREGRPRPCMRNLPGWLRLGWLKMPQLTLTQLKLHWNSETRSCSRGDQVPREGRRQEIRGLW